MMRLKALLFAALLTACGGGDRVLPEDSVVRGVNYVGVVVSDLDATAQLYSSATDLGEVHRESITESAALKALSGGRDVTAETLLLRTANAQIQLMSFSEAPDGWKAVPVQGPGIAHVCTQVAQSTETYQRFLENGATHIGSPELIQLNPRNPVYYGYVEDLDGAVIEIEHVDIEALNLDTPPPNQYRLRHVALATPDVERLAAFYSILLDQPNPRNIGGRKGFSGDRIDAVSGLEGSQLRMFWFQLRNLELEISQFVSHPTELPSYPRPVDAPGYNMIVLDVKDLDAAKAKFLEAGGTIETETENFNGAPTIFGRDPDGNIIGLQSAPASSVVSSQNFSGNGT